MLVKYLISENFQYLNGWWGGIPQKNAKASPAQQKIKKNAGNLVRKRIFLSCHWFYGRGRSQPENFISIMNKNIKKHTAPNPTLETQFCRVQKFNLKYEKFRMPSCGKFMTFNKTAFSHVVLSRVVVIIHISLGASWRVLHILCISTKWENQLKHGKWFGSTSK